MDDPETAFPVMDPFIVKEDYDPVINEDILKFDFAKEIKHSNYKEVKEALKDSMPKDCCILIKGSNSMKLASLISYL